FLLEYPALGLALEVERVRPPDLVAADDHLVPHLLRPRDLARVPLLPPVAEEGLVDLVDLHRDAASGEPLRGLPREGEGFLRARGRRLEEHGVRGRGDDLHLPRLALPDDALGPV